jgi:hypothetical protein
VRDPPRHPAKGLRGNLSRIIGSAEMPFGLRATPNGKQGYSQEIDCFQANWVVEFAPHPGANRGKGLKRAVVIPSPGQKLAMRLNGGHVARATNGRDHDKAGRAKIRL